LVVGWLALRLSACEFGSDVAGLHFVMRSEHTAVCHATAKGCSLVSGFTDSPLVLVLLP
jgi:hypothetical protein